ncbi:hypothetical protein PPERSA_02881 [Pseudocohnilembus persalinus]|uniref:Uncharacterized protein n=1 Tax=Pseudocohnilembus persalinus TaxID=266149 RepID=A0A0V0QML9_PSEPJ|nr:hypothetical protein PPERSA_02881 [Pseudocohnilembus persalinus]|eukprot:KRX03502.1 hypothetical protein PPERSA_02881 [Pseudocohnilembus persalinus]
MAMYKILLQDTYYMLTISPVNLVNNFSDKDFYHTTFIVQQQNQIKGLQQQYTIKSKWKQMLQRQKDEIQQIAEQPDTALYSREKNLENAKSKHKRSRIQFVLFEIILSFLVFFLINLAVIVFFIIAFLTLPIFVIILINKLPGIQSQNIRFTEEELDRLVPITNEIIYGFVKDYKLDFIWTKYQVNVDDYQILTEKIWQEMFLNKNILIGFQHITLNLKEQTAQISLDILLNQVLKTAQLSMLDMLDQQTILFLKQNNLPQEFLPGLNLTLNGVELTKFKIKNKNK